MNKTRREEFEERLEALEQRMYGLEGEERDMPSREEFDDLKDNVNEIAHMMLSW